MGRARRSGRVGDPGLYQLGQPSLWIDEAATAVKSRSRTGTRAPAPLVDYTMLKPWTALAGTSEIALRFPSVLVAALACALLVPLGNRLSRAPGGLIAGVVLALNPFVVQWSQQARSYTIVMLVAIVSTWMFLELRERATRRAWATYTVCLMVFILIQPLSAGLLAGAHFLAARGFRTRIVMAGIAGMLATSIFSLACTSATLRAGTLVWNVDPTIGSVSRVVLELSGALGVGLALAFVGLALIERERLLIGCWAFAPLLISIALTPIGKVFVDRYVIVSTPAFALLVAAAVVGLRGVWRVSAIGVPWRRDNRGARHLVLTERLPELAW